MIEELDNKYLVLKWDDIIDIIDNSNTRKLAIMIEKINKSRAKRGSKPNKKYVVVSEDMKCYGLVEEIVLDEINNIDRAKKLEAEFQRKLNEERKKWFDEQLAKNPAVNKKVAPKPKMPENKTTTLAGVKKNVKDKD